MNLLLLILATVAAAPNDPGAVSAGDVLNCDFEERTDRDYDAWPDGWTRQRSRELPEFLKIGIVQEPIATAPSPTSTNSKSSIAAKALENHCLEVALNGGGAVVASSPQPVSTQFSLSLTARIKTSGLTHDGAWVELSLIDDEGHVLQHRVTQPLTNCPNWTTVEIPPIDVLGNKVTKAVVSLHVRPLGKHEDLSGRVWFDDVRIMRLPRMQLSSSGPTGIYDKRDSAELICAVSGIRVRNPRVRFELFDHEGQLLADSSTPLLSAQDAAKWATKQLPPDGYAGRTTWTPPFPDYGFYRVRASLFAEN